MEKETQYNPSTRWAGKQGIRSGEATEETESQEQEGTSLFFTVQRQNSGRVEAISFILRNGRQHTLAADGLHEIYFEATYGVVLFFGLGSVHIQGRNLGGLYRYLKENRVKEIREFSDNSQVFFTEDALFISKIVYESQNLLRLGIT